MFVSERLRFALILRLLEIPLMSTGSVLIKYVLDTTLSGPSITMVLGLTVISTIAYPFQEVPLQQV
jgi:hypothetical protein